MLLEVSGDLGIVWRGQRGLVCMVPEARTHVIQVREDTKSMLACVHALRASGIGLGMSSVREGSITVELLQSQGPACLLVDQATGVSGMTMQVGHRHMMTAGLWKTVCGIARATRVNLSLIGHCIRLEMFLQYVVDLQH